MRFYFGVVATPDRAGGSSTAAIVVWIALRRMVAAAAFLLVAALLGAIPSAWGVLAIPAAALTAAAFCAPLGCVLDHAGHRPVVPDDHAARRAAAVLVLGHVLPDQPAPRRARSRSRALSPLWHGVELARAATTGSFDLWPDHRPCRVPRRMYRGRRGVRRPELRPAAERMTTTTPRTAPLPPTRLVPFVGWRRRPWRLVERNVARVPAHVVHLLERASPSRCLFLLSIGIGVGKLVGDLHVGGQTVSYQQFVAPGLLAVGGDERLAARHDVQLLRQDEVRAHVRRSARDTARNGRRRRRRDHVGAAARRRCTRRCSCSRCGCSATSPSWWSVLALPAARAHRLRFRRSRTGGDHVHAVVRRLRLREHGDHPAVLVLRHVLPARASIPPDCRRSSASRRSTKVSCSTARSLSAISTGRWC